MTHFFVHRDEGEERVPVNRPAIPASTLSRSALYSHRPLGLGRIAHSRLLFLVAPNLDIILLLKQLS